MSSIIKQAIKPPLQQSISAPSPQIPSINIINELPTTQQQQQTPLCTSTSSTSTITNDIIKPLEMNTYVQLEIDNSSSIQIPRICKFYIKKLQIQKNLDPTAQSATQIPEINSIYIAIKLNISKRILRTIEIPISQLQSNQTIISIDLNLYYNIIYPHYIKKDNNYLYIYIQRRKKYKNRTILGYKTMAHTVIDLNNCIQKTIQQHNFFLQQHEQQSSSNSSTKMRRLGDYICGYITINSLCSNPLDYNEIEQQQQQQRNQNQTSYKQIKNVISNLNDVDLDDLDLIDDEYTAAASSSANGTSGNSNINTVGNSGISAFINAKNKAIHNMNAALSGITGNLNNVLNSRNQSGSISAGNTVMSNLSTSNHASALNSNNVGAAAASAGGGNSDSEIETEHQHNQHHHHHHHQQSHGNKNNNKQFEMFKRNTNTNLIQPTKKLTGKLISFIRKLRNEVDDEIEEEDEAHTNNEIDDFDIEQISDFSDTDFDDSNLDLYSIISTPKPCIQPFFKKSSEITAKNETNIDTLSNNNQQVLLDDDYDNENEQINNYNLLDDSNDTRDNIETDVGVHNTSSDNEQLTTTTQSNQAPLKTQIDLQPYKITFNNIQLYLDDNQQATSTNDNITFYLINELQLLNTSNPPVHLYTKLSEINTQQQQNNLFVIKNDGYLKDFKLLFETIIQWLQHKQQTQHLLNSSSSNNTTNTKKQFIKIILFGTDQFLNQFLQIYVDIFKTQDLISTFKFFYIPYFNNYSTTSPLSITSSFMFRFLCSLDQQYMSLFGDDAWLNLDMLDSKIIVERIKRYLSNSNFSYVPFQICEAMVIRQADDLPPQFIPFICDFRIGDELNETQQTTANQQIDRFNNASPPNSPHLNLTNENSENEYDLQVDYWAYTNSSFLLSSTTSTNAASLPPNILANNTQPNYNLHQTLPNSLTNQATSLNVPLMQNSFSSTISQPIQQNNTTKINKSTIKALFKSLQIYHHIPSKNFNQIICQHGQEASLAAHNLAVIYVIREKKQKIMRLGKKSKENEQKKETIDGITRLVCTSRTKNVPLKVFIDGVVLSNIKFFQISSQWQGHIKYLNIMFGTNNQKAQSSIIDTNQ